MKNKKLSDSIEFKDDTLRIGQVSGPFDELKCMEIVSSILEKLSTDNVSLVECGWIYGCILDFVLAIAKAQGKMEVSATTEVMTGIIEHVVKKQLVDSKESVEKENLKDEYLNQYNYKTKH